MKKSSNIAPLCFVPFIRLYQWCISPWLGTCCRFEPSCSRYAEEALNTHGFFKGGWFTLKRLCRCQPFGSSGVDPVPPKHC